MHAVMFYNKICIQKDESAGDILMDVARGGLSIISLRNVKASDFANFQNWNREVILVLYDRY